MYGGQAKTAEQLATDQRFITDVLQQYATPQAAAAAYLNRGWQYLESGSPIVAIKRFNQAWLLDSTSADVYFSFSAYLRQQGQAAEEERFMTIARRHDTANRSLLRYYGNLGALQEAHGNRPAAIAAYEQLRQLSPDDTVATRRLGYQYMQQQDTARANQLLTRAVALDARDSVSYLNRGWLRYSQKRYAAAVLDFTRALEINPHYISAYANRALAYTDAGNYPAALADWQRGLELVPPRSKAEFYRLIGQTKLQAKDPEGACVAFQQALQWGDTPATDKEVRRLMKANCR